MVSAAGSGLGVALGSPRPSDRAHVRARLEPLAPEDRLACVRAASDHVRAPHRLLEALDGTGVGMTCRERAGTVRITRRQADLLEIADPRKGLEMRPTLHTGTEDGQH